MKTNYVVRRIAVENEQTWRKPSSCHAPDYMGN